MDYKDNRIRQFCYALFNLISCSLFNNSITALETVTQCRRELLYSHIIDNSVLKQQQRPCGWFLESVTENIKNFKFHLCK